MVFLFITLFVCSLVYLYPPKASATSYDYYMNISGANYQILNSGHSVVYSSTSSSTAFNWLYGVSGTGANNTALYVESGSYSVDYPWYIYKGGVSVTFQSSYTVGAYGSGAAGAILTAVAHASATSTDDIMLWVLGCDVTITGATLNGNGLNQLPAYNVYLYDYMSGVNYNHGIYVGYSGFYTSGCLIQYSTVYNVRCFGITTGWGSNAPDFGVMYCKVYNVGANGISTGATDSYFINNDVFNCGDVGIDTYGTNTNITGNVVHSSSLSTLTMYGYNNALWAIGAENGGGTGSGKYLFVGFNWVYDYAGSAVVVSGAGGYAIDYAFITSNTITSIDNIYGWYAINLDWSSHSQITLNTISDATYGIGIGVGMAPGGYSTSNNIYGNSFSSVTTQIQDLGTGTTYNAPTIAAIKVTSTPTLTSAVSANGVYSYAGDSGVPPYVFYGTVGASIPLVAHNVVGYTFNSWSDSGAQSHSITIAAAGDEIYTATYLPVTGGTTFGVTSVGSLHTTFNTGIPRLQQATPTADGTLTSISIYLTGSGSGRHVKTAIYSDDGADYPDELLDESSSDEILSDGWHVFTGFSISVTAGTKYWLATMSDSASVEWYYENGGANYVACATTSSTYPTFPDPVPDSQYEDNYNVSIYATYTVPDTTAPTYSDLSVTSTVAGTSVSFTANFDDNLALETNGEYSFYSNNTGTIIEYSTAHFTETPQGVGVGGVTLNPIVGVVVAYEWNFTDNAGNSNSTGWLYLTTTAPAPTATPTPAPTGFVNDINSDWLWQYLYNYDLIGFIIACWVADLGESFYVIISIIVTIALYIRLKSLPVMIAMWFILGGLWISLLPMVSPIILLLIIFGVASLLIYIFMVSKY